MGSKFRVALSELPLTLLIGAAGPARLATAQATTYLVSLSGVAAASNAADAGLRGDMDGSGRVKLTVDLDARRICYDFTLAELATPLMAHIHKAPAQHDGPSVVTLFTGPGGDLNDCVMWTEKWLTEIVADPSGFYVNLSTTEFPDGALRGQLLG